MRPPTCRSGVTVTTACPRRRPRGRSSARPRTARPDAPPRGRPTDSRSTAGLLAAWRPRTVRSDGPACRPAYCLLIAWFVSAQLFEYCLLRSLFGRHLLGTTGACWGEAQGVGVARGFPLLDA